MYAARCVLLISSKGSCQCAPRSIDCINALVDLEEEYADYRRNVVDGFGDLSKTTQEICHYLAETIQENNRNGLSKNFSNTFFTLPLPVIISNPKLVH